MKNILIINGNPNEKSLSTSIVNELAKSINKVSNQIKTIHLYELQFDPILWNGYQKIQELEPDLVSAQNSIKEANHIVFVYPSWWGLFPALLKGFIDRVFLPGFAFKYQDNGFPQKLLQGKTSELIVTMDTPIWFYKYVVGALGIKMMTRSILGFCGIKNKRVTLLSPIRQTTNEQREQILKKVQGLGSTL